MGATTMANDLSTGTYYYAAAVYLDVVASVTAKPKTIKGWPYTVVEVATLSFSMEN